MTSFTAARRSPSHVRLALRVLSLFAFALVLAGCVSTREDRFWTHAPGWSRAQNIGMTGSMRPISIDVDENGTLYAVYFELEPETEMTVLAVGSDGTENWRYSFDTVDILEGRNPALMSLNDGVHVFWIVQGNLVEMHLSDEGELRGIPTVISHGESVINFDLARSVDGSYSIWFSSSRDNPGIYRLDPEVDGYSSTLVDADGVYPDIAYDSNGALHAVWACNANQLDSMTFEYRLYDGGFHERAEASRSIKPSLRSSDDVEGPTLGLNGMLVHIGWITNIRTGLRAGQVEPMVASFVPGFEETYSAPEQMRITTEFDLPYEDWEGDLHVGQRVAWSVNRYGTDQIKDFATLVTDFGETAFASRTRVDTRSGQNQSQITIAYLKDGVFDSYQLLTFTYSSSVTPSIAASADGYLYAVWLELTDANEFGIYLASTVPAMCETYDSLTKNDVIQMVSDTVFGMISGILLTPVVFLWLIPGMLILVLTGWLRRGEGVRKHVMEGISVGLGMAGYWFAKTRMFPSILTSIPFKLWIPIISPGMGLVLKVLVPVVVTLIAVGIGLRNVRKRGTFSPAPFLLVYGLIDGICTVAIYGADFIRI